VSKITGKQAGAFKNQKFFSRALYFDDQGKNAIVTFTKTKSGVRVDQFISGTQARNFKVLEETTKGGKTVFIDFNRYVSRVGDPIYVKGATLSDQSVKSIFNRFIGRDQLFTGFADDLAPYTIGRTQQVISISPKVAKGATYTVGGKSVKVLSETDQVQTFASIGSSRVARTDALKSLIKQITKQEGGFAVVTKGLLASKRGQVALPSFTKSQTELLKPTTIQLPSSAFSQDQFVSVSPLLSKLTPTIKSTIAQNALRGTLVVAGTASGLQARQPQREELTQRLLSLQLQNLTQIPIQEQTPVQKQTQQQQQQQVQQTLQQQLQQQVQITPNIIPTPTPTPVSPPVVDLPGFQLEFFEKVRKKADRKRSGKDLAYVQDFTSKVVGFKPIEVSEEEAVKLAQKVQTGFEIRQPIIVRRNNKDAKRLKKLLSQ
jgi:hypothetical protein